MKFLVALLFLGAVAAQYPAYPKPQPAFSLPTSYPSEPKPSYPKPPAYPSEPKPSYPTPPAYPSEPKPAYPSEPKPSYTQPAAYPSEQKPSYPKPEYTTAMPMPFDFAWAVKDDPSYNNYAHKATSDGNLVTGSYRVALPDGRTQIVNYRADDNGYVAEVTYEGEAKYP